MPSSKYYVPVDLKKAAAQTVAGATLALVLPHDSFATQYSLEYGVESFYRSNDNVGLRPDNEVDVHGVEVAVPAVLELQDERYTAQLDGRIASTKYDDSGYDSDDQKLHAKGEYLLERGGFNGSVGINRDSTTETAFLDNGVVGASASRVEKYLANLGSLYSLAEDYTLTASISYRESNYHTDRLVDNETRAAYLGLIHQYTPKTSLQLQANVSRFENDARIGVESDGVGLQLGFNTQVTESFTVAMLGGYSEIDTQYFTPADVPARDDDSNTGWVLSSSLQYSGERSSIEASFQRQETASGDGYLIVSNRLRSEYSYKLTEQATLKLNFVAGNSGALDDAIKNDRDYAEGGVQLTYRFAESWYVSGRYKYRYQDRERAAGDAGGNLFLASISYRPKAITWSR